MSICPARAILFFVLSAWASHASLSWAQWVANGIPAVSRVVLKKEVA